MKNIKVVLMYICFTSILVGCGGVVGNIEKYNFPGTTYDQLNEEVKNILLKNPRMIYKNMVSDSTDSRYYYCILMDDEDKFVFRFSLIDGVPPYDPMVQIALVSGAEYGETLYLEKNIGFFKKRTLKRIFEDKFLAKVDSSLAIKR